MGARSQRKGRGGELEICKIFQAHGIDAKPGQAVSFGSTPDAVIPGIHPEIKRVERLSVPGAMARPSGTVRNSRMGHRYYSIAETVGNGSVLCD